MAGSVWPRGDEHLTQWPASAFGGPAPTLGQHPGLVGAGAVSNPDPFGIASAGAVSMSDDRGANGVGPFGVNRDMTITYTVRPTSKEEFHNNVRRYALMFIERGNTKLATGVSGVGRMDQSTVEVAEVMRHLSRVNYELQINRSIAGYTSPDRVHNKYWMAGVAKAVPLEAMRSAGIMSKHGELVITSVMGRVTAFDYWTASYEENRRFIKTNRLGHKIRVPRRIKQGTPLWLLLVEVGVEEAGMRHRALQSKLSALGGPGMDIEGLTTDELVYDRDGRAIDLRLSRRSRENLESNTHVQDAGEETFKCEMESPVCFRYLPWAQEDGMSICDELLYSRAPGRKFTGPMGIAIFVGYADTETSTKDIKSDCSLYQRIICPVVDNEWEEALSALSIRDIRLHSTASQSYD